MPEAFVYSWRNLSTNRIYVGFHKGQTDDGYICSSAILREEYTEDPNNFERMIIAHGTVEDMVALEEAILVAVDAKNNPAFYNQHNGNGLYFCKQHTKESRKKIGLAQLGRKRSEETKRKMSEKARARDPKCYLRPNGINRSPEWRKKMEAYWAKGPSDETRAKYRAAKLGKKRKPHSEETKAKMRASHQRRNLYAKF